MKLDRLLNVTGLSWLMNRREDAIKQLAREGKLGSTLLEAIRDKGIPVTPYIRNSVDAVVSAISLDSSIGASMANRDVFDAAPIALKEGVFIMFTDIVDSTSLVEKLGDQRAREVFRSHNEIVRRHTEKHRGEEIKVMGDGFMLTFQSVNQAIGCAIATQRELQKYNRENSDVALSVRMGISVGMPIREEEDLFGKPVILAARVSAQAEGGQVLICDSVHALAGDAAEFSFKELAPVELKGFSDAYTLYEVVWREP